MGGYLNFGRFGGAALPVVEDWAATAFVADASPSFTAPAGITAGDLLVICISHERGGSGGAFNHYTTPSGWQRGPETQGATTDGAGNFIGHFLIWKIADGGEGAVEIVQHTTSARTGVGYYVRVSGVDPDDPIPSISSIATSGAETTLDCVLTTNSANMLGLGFFAQEATGTLGVSGTGWTKIDETAGGTDNDAMFATGSLEAAGSHTPTFSGNNLQNKSAVVVSVNPLGYADEYSGPEVEGYALTSTTVDGTAISVTAPSGITAGELLVIAIVSRANNPAATYHSATGWSSAVQAGDSSADAKASILYKIATGSEGNVTVNCTGTSFSTAAWYIRISGAAAAGIVEDTGGIENTGSTENRLLPELAPTVANNNCFGIHLVAIRDDPGPSSLYGDLVVTEDFEDQDLIGGVLAFSRIAIAGTSGAPVLCENEDLTTNDGNQKAACMAYFNAA